MTIREQYKYAQCMLRWHETVNNDEYMIKHGYFVDHEWFIRLIENVRLDILMKAWQTL